MTAQINDMFEYQDVVLAVAGISEGESFDPSLLDLNPAGLCSACWRGYQAVFAISNTRLVLDKLHINLLAEGEDYPRLEGPSINGVLPTASTGEYDWFNNHYEGLEYHLEYSGGLLLAEGFIESLYVHMGFHPPWKYRHVVELILENGVLQQEFDRSEKMAEIRDHFASRKQESSESFEMPSQDAIREFVERAFDRTYLT